MSRALHRQVAQIKVALLCGDPHAALARIDDLMQRAARRGIDPETRDGLEPLMEELRELAQASLHGARQAAEQVRAIVQAARSLQTYDSQGRRHVTSMHPNAAQRF
ncbi:MAG: hypothetical protein FJX25_16850 [Alphaproteobacteria bacterium]|nr:hypothetical protein [Alphaproteobacteria bacterium]